MKYKNETLFWNKWMVANCIITSLKNGYYIDVELMNKAKKYYKDCIKHKELKKYTSLSFSIFKNQVTKILKKIEAMKPFKSNKRMIYYEPFFKL